MINAKYIRIASVQRFDIILPKETPLSFIDSADLGIGQNGLAFSPDGNLFAYIGQQDSLTKIFIRLLHSEDVQALEGTEGAYYPFFSPDGDWLGFFANGYLKKVAIRGGKPIVLCEATIPNGAVWLQDGRIFFADFEGYNLSWIDAEGGQVHELRGAASAGTNGLAFPSQLNKDYLLVSDYPRGLNAISIESGEIIPLLDRGSNPLYLETGHLCYVDFDRLMVVPFDFMEIAIKGSTFSTVNDLRTELYSAHAAISKKGDLIYALGTPYRLCQYTFRSDDGLEETLPIKPDYYGQAKISMDGKKLLFLNESSRDLYVYHLRTKTSERITRGGNIYRGIWGPEKDDITYCTQKGIFRVKLYSDNAPVQIVSSSYTVLIGDWDREGQILMYQEFRTDDPVTRFHHISQSEERTLPEEIEGYLSSFSPDDRYVAYTSTSSGRSEVYVQPFPITGDRWQIFNFKTVHDVSKVSTIYCSLLIGKTIPLYHSGLNGLRPINLFDLRQYRWDEW